MELQDLHQKIVTLRGSKVMLDFDLAQLYEVETKALNQAVKRNIIRFPADFMFKITSDEWDIMRSQNVTASQNKRNVSNTPYAFTEQGVAMLSSVLKSDKAALINIAIMRAFVEIRNMLSYKNELSQQLKELKQELEVRLGEQDTQIIEIYDVLDKMMDKKGNDERKKIGYK
jgi:hypothetical protein